MLRRAPGREMLLGGFTSGWRDFHLPLIPEDGIRPHDVFDIERKSPRAIRRLPRVRGHPIGKFDELRLDGQQRPVVPQPAFPELIARVDSGEDGNDCPGQPKKRRIEPEGRHRRNQRRDDDGGSLKRLRRSSRYLFAFEVMSPTDSGALR